MTLLPFPSLHQSHFPSLYYGKPNARAGCSIKKLSFPSELKQRSQFYFKRYYFGGGPRAASTKLVGTFNKSRPAVQSVSIMLPHSGLCLRVLPQKTILNEPVLINDKFCNRGTKLYLAPSMESMT